MARMMIHRFAMLLEYEKSALLEALRRDHRSEERRAASNPQDAEYHLMNSRASLKLLEALNPKQIGTGKQVAGPMRAVCEEQVVREKCIQYDFSWEQRLAYAGLADCA